MSVELISSNNKLMEKKEAKPKITLTIKDMKIVSTWKYNVENDICSMCRCDLMIPTQRSIRSTYTDFNSKVNGNVTIGACKHGFHENCISRWIKDGNISCPTCKTTWKAANHVGNAVYMYKSTGIS
jgi:hypothetical protein